MQNTWGSQSLYGPLTLPPSTPVLYTLVIIVLKRGDD